MQEQTNEFSIPSLNEYLEKESEYSHLLDNLEFWRRIPIINYIPLTQVKDLSIVRFRGMIQDMQDPEIYLERYKVISTVGGEKYRFQNGKYQDFLSLRADEKVEFENKENVQGERRTMFVVSLPAMNTWARALEEANSCSPESNTAATRGVKLDYQNSKRLNGELEQHNKRRCMDIDSITTSDGVACLSAEYLLNSPIPHPQSKACMVKLYTNFDEYPLNTFVDVLGFLSVDPVLDASMMDTSDEYFENRNEFQAKNPPPLLIPRIHAVAIKKLAHSNPLLDPLICRFISSNICVESIYKDTKILLTQCFLGDELCAEYFLLHLMSSIYSRTDLQTVGKFAMNIYNLPKDILPEYPQQFYSFLEIILPTSHYIPMTLENINTMQLLPKKDYDTNKLVSGVLQLAPHTHLVVDETRLESGQLNHHGIQAIQGIADLIKSQQITCDFHYYKINFDVDVPVLVFSEGSSLLPSDFSIPLDANPDQVCVWDETLKAAKHYAQPKLEAIRRYLTSTKLHDFHLHPDNSEMIQTDFVKMRQSDPRTTGDDLHALLLLSRLLAIAQGESTFSRDCWERAKHMETLRKVRVQKLPSSSGRK